MHNAKLSFRLRLIIIQLNCCRIFLLPFASSLCTTLLLVLVISGRNELSNVEERVKIVLSKKDAEVKLLREKLEKSERKVEVRKRCAL